MRRLWALVAMTGLLAACATDATQDPSVAAATGSGPERAERLTVEVLATYPHDRTAFTQGLELHDGLLYEGTGLEGRSELRTVRYETGEVTARVALPDDVFGEGITIVGGHIWQLTWQDGVAFHRDLASLDELRRVSYDGEGWGICYDGTRLVMSDGSAALTFRDPQTFDATGSVTVTLDGEPLTMLNELECVAGRVWANVWQTDQIVRIDPATGVVEAVVDASGLLSDEERVGADVLNGIAAIDSGDTFLITGKWWPTLFEVRFVPAE